MRILACHPGADYSTHDVFTGLTAGLRDLGHDVTDYKLNIHLARAASWLRHNYKRVGLGNPTLERVCYEAGKDLVIGALETIPDWVLIFTANFVHPNTVLALKRAGAPVGIIGTESPYDDLIFSDRIRIADIAWTNERSSVPYLRQSKPNTHYLPHALNPGRHRLAPPDPAVPAHDVVFVGTLFQERIELLEAVDWTGIDFGLYGEAAMLPSRHRLRRYLRGGITDNARAAALYRRARIGLNLYRRSIGAGRGAPRIAHAESLNPRAYELAATGCFHLSEYREEVDEVFGDSVPVFAGPRQLRQQILWFLEHEGQRRRLAAQLPAKVAGHTWRDRAEIVTAGLRATTPSPPEKMLAAEAAS